MGQRWRAARSGGTCRVGWGGTCAFPLTGARVLATEEETEGLKKELERLLAEIDLLEEMWARLPERLRLANSDLADRLEKLPLKLH
jgi:hypothetical protein